MSIEDLPEHEELVLVVANPHQRDIAIECQHTQWSRGKNIDNYRVEHAELGSGPWNQDFGSLYWVLVKRDDQEGRFYSSCESHRRAAFNRPAGRKEVESGTIYAISSVITAPEHRKRGYATLMLKLLHLRFAPSHSYEGLATPFNIPPPLLSPRLAPHVPRATASVLWSDVGSAFYAKVTIPGPEGQEKPGWVVTPGLGDNAVRWTPTEPAPTEQTWSWIYYDDLDAVAQSVSVDVKAELESRPVNPTTSITTYDPASPGLHKYLLEKSRHKDRRDSPYTEPIGARIPRREGKDIIILYAPRFFVTSELSLALVHNADAEDMPAILSVLSAVLEKEGCQQVVAWGLEPALTKAFVELGGREERRKEIDGHLLGVALYPEGNWALEGGQAIEWC